MKIFLIDVSTFSCSTIHKWFTNNRVQIFLASQVSIYGVGGREASPPPQDFED